MAKRKSPLPPPLPAFEPVSIKPRHDGFSADRQRAFIAALADTGSVTRAARACNIPTKTAYRLRRQVGADSFRRAWEAALDLGVQRLKDELYERALEGQLKPVFIGGKLKGFQRVKSDRLLMFALRMNAKDEHGRRMAASYFDPGAQRLHAGTGVSDGGDRARPTPLPPAARTGPDPGGEGAGGLVMPRRIAGTVAITARTRAERDNHNAAMVEHFDPVALTLPEIEAMQAALVEEARRRRTEEDGPPDRDPNVDFIDNRDGQFKALGPLEDIVPVVREEDREDEFDEEEDRWWNLGEDD